MNRLLEGPELLMAVAAGLNAGELRAAGYEVEAEVPDCARLVCDAIDPTKSEVSIDDDNGVLNFKIKVKPRWQWLIVDMVIGPAGEPQP